MHLIVVLATAEEVMVEEEEVEVEEEEEVAEITGAKKNHQKLKKEATKMENKIQNQKKSQEDKDQVIIEEAEEVVVVGVVDIDVDQDLVVKDLGTNQELIKTSITKIAQKETESEKTDLQEGEAIQADVQEDTEDDPDDHLLNKVQETKVDTIIVIMIVAEIIQTTIVGNEPAMAIKGVAMAIKGVVMASPEIVMASQELAMASHELVMASHEDEAEVDTDGTEK